MIRLNHVSKIYGDGSKKAVDDLSWDIEDGKITGFIGPNGAGKTTTLKMITGILAPSEGTIEINGKDIQKDPLEAKRQFGFVPDDPDAFLRVRGIEYLNFMADIYGVGTEERQRFIEETAKRFDGREPFEPYHELLAWHASENHGDGRTDPQAAGLDSR